MCLWFKKSDAMDKSIIENRERERGATVKQRTPPGGGGRDTHAHTHTCAHHTDKWHR